MLLFKQKFLEAIRSGEKCQTIRLWKHRRMRVGQRSFIPGIASIKINLNHWDFPNLSNVDIPNVTAGLKELDYKAKFGVVVDCESEDEQKKVFEFITGGGYKARIVSI